jgi:hypothetical protein
MRKPIFLLLFWTAFGLALAFLRGFDSAALAQTAASGRAGGTGTQLFIPNAQTSTYQTIQTDWQFCKTIPVASGTFTITLTASTSQPAAGQCISIINYGSGVVTVAPSGQNINGSGSSLTIPAGSAATPTGLWIYSDGTNYVAQRVGASALISDSGGTSGWSGTPLTFATSATQYAAPVGGALTSTTESVVQLKAPTSSTITELQVTLSAALGVSATLTVTLRDGGASTALTCTTSSGGTTCSDLAHSVSVAQNDSLDFLLVSSGTVSAGLPQVEIGYSVATSTGTGTISLPPYLAAGGNLYIPADNMYLATLPSLGSYGASCGNTPLTVTTNANGDVTLSGSNGCLADPSHVTSIETVMRPLLPSSSANAAAGIFFCDSTNSRIYEFALVFDTGPNYDAQLQSEILTSNSTCTTSVFSSSPLTVGFVNGTPLHMKGAVAGGTLTFSYSPNGGVSFIPLYSVSVGTILKMGYTGNQSVFSAVVN